MISMVHAGLSLSLSLSLFLFRSFSASGILCSYVPTLRNARRAAIDRVWHDFGRNYLKNLIWRRTVSEIFLSMVVEFICGRRIIDVHLNRNVGEKN